MLFLVFEGLRAGGSWAMCFCNVVRTDALVSSISTEFGMPLEDVPLMAEGIAAPRVRHD